MALSARRPRAFVPLVTPRWGAEQEATHAVEDGLAGPTEGEFLMRTTSSRRPLFYGWVIVATAFVIAAVTTGPRNSFGVFVGPMSLEFGWNRSTISLAAAIGFLV